MKGAYNIALKHVAKSQFNVQNWYNRRAYVEDIKTADYLKTYLKKEVLENLNLSGKKPFLR